MLTSTSFTISSWLKLGFTPIGEQGQIISIMSDTALAILAMFMFAFLQGVYMYATDLFKSRCNFYPSFIFYVDILQYDSGKQKQS